MSSNSVHLLSIPEKTHPEIDLWNAFFGIRRALKWGSGKSRWELQWFADTGVVEPKYVLVFKIGELEYCLGLAAWPNLSLASIILDAESIEALPKDISVLYLEAALENALGAFEQNYSGPVRLMHIGHEWPAQCAAGATRFHWKWTGGDHALLAEGLIELKFEQLESLKSHLERLPLVSDEALIGAIEWEVRLELGSTVLNTDDFRSLNLSDVIIFDDHAKLQQGGVRVWVDELIVYEAKLQDNTITLKTMSENPDALSTRNVLNPESQIEALPITLSFEVGRRRLTLNEIKALSPGFTFEFHDKPIERPITIIANGVAVGTGELVQVGDVLGVRVLGWSALAKSEVAAQP